MDDDADTRATCLNFQFFKLALRDARTIDDRINTRINGLRERSSVSSPSDFRGKCQSLKQELEASEQSRQTFINTCIAYVEEEVQKKREQGQPVLVAETELRLMRSELNVEQILRDKSMRTFSDKCR
ncbi:coiled-coil domain-containing protein 58 [Gonapodya prolifera JEL478]|uniref:Coiled-coil domain-containing protein 58 n=1 Tax=Gonapodya prolifera (strain JEL478) TaxID=1344416 RepID=A0A139ASH3_GONPJ|nr:coiled-coil domain-containing protein 58 [Gonapodya prolifera JEL478]|eukprot:KXS19696.1 coiled-coil domain-containing protein 58 [Gonapodya prolifera JEL478]